mgnify:FL=1
MASLAEIRARLAAADNKQGNQSSNSGDGAIYPHWNMNEGDSALLRFLPDADNSNTFFWIERAMIKLPFNGIKGQMDSKSVQVQVPCVEMWGETCPILTEVRAWFKDKSLEDMGRKYWKKRSYIMQGFVRENPISDDKSDKAIRRFIIGPQIFQTIKSALMDPELEELPTDYERGLDFRISKTSKGGYADYSTSKWARKETSLTTVEAEAIESQGLYNLSDFLPKRPGEAEIKVMKEMFEASVDGQSYDAERWGNYFRPAGMQAPAPGATAPQMSVQTTPAELANIPFHSNAEAAAPTPTAPIVKPAVVEPSSKAEDILAMIRSRQAAN